MVVLATTAMLVAACGDDHAGVAAGDGAPQFCEPVRKAFKGLFEVESSEYEAYTRAAQVAAQNLREAEKSAPPDLVGTIRSIADFYEKTAERGHPLALSQIQELLLPHAGKLGEAVEDQCGFTLAGA